MTTDFISAILIIAAVLLGAVELWSSSLVLVLVFTLGLYWVIRKGYLEYETGRTSKALIAVGASFLAYILLQVIPVPSEILGFFSPSARRLYDFYKLDPDRMTFISLHPYRTLNEILRYLAGAILFVIAAKNFRDRTELSRAMKTLVIFGFILGVFGIIQKATWNGSIYWFRELPLGGVPFGPFVNRNHFAGFIGMIIPLGLGLLFTRRRTDNRLLFGFLTVIMSVALFFSLSRGGIVSFLSGISVFTVLMVASRMQIKRVWIIGIFLMVLLSYLLYLGIDPVLERFISTDITKEQRLVVGAATIDAIKDFPLTGSGLGTFVNVFPLYSPPEVRSIYDHAHNDYLEFILETGAIGLLMLLAFISILIYGLSRTSFQGRTGTFRIAVISSLSTMAVHGVFDFNLHILSNLLLFSTVLGMAASLIEPNEREAGGDIQPARMNIETRPEP